MFKIQFNKILLLAFFITILLVSYLELQNNIRQIKVEYIEVKPRESNNTGQEIVDNSKTNNSMIEASHQSKQEKSRMGNWKSIERKDSYNNELQYYSKDNVVIKEDSIEITSKKETKEDKMYTSGLVESTNAFKYGYFEFTIEISEGKGIFPAIWFLPKDGGAYPEIDLFEMIGSEPHTFYGVIHFEENGIKSSDYFAHEVPIKEKYTVSLDWRAESLTWYIDNQEIYSTTQGVPQIYMFIVINQAIGGNWPGDPDSSTIFPNQFKILSTHIDPVFKKGRD